MLKLTNNQLKELNTLTKGTRYNNISVIQSLIYNLCFNNYNNLYNYIKTMINNNILIK